MLSFLLPCASPFSPIYFRGSLANASFSTRSNRAASILIIALGTMYYTWAKSAESAQPRPGVPPRDPVDLEKAESALAKHAAEASSGVQK